MIFLLPRPLYGKASHCFARVGQSLIPLLKLRFARPTALIDIGGIADLKSITVDDRTVVSSMTGAKPSSSSTLLTQRGVVDARRLKSLDEPVVVNPDLWTRTL